MENLKVDQTEMLGIPANPPSNGVTIQSTSSDNELYQGGKPKL